MHLRLFLFLLFLFPLTLLGQDLNLSKDSIYNKLDTIGLKEVSVSASKGMTVSGMLTGNLKLTVDQLQSVPSLTGMTDVLKLMELTPSVRTSGDGSSNMYVRGGDAGQNLIRYNGITSYTSGHVLGIFPLFNADHLSWVKMSKGGADAEYGNFISSVIEVNSKYTVPSRLSVKGSVGLLASQATVNIPISKDWGAYLSGRKTYLNLIAQPLIEKIFSSSTNEDTNIGYDFWDTNLTILGKINDRHSLKMDVMMSSDVLNLDDEEIVINGSLKWRNILSSVDMESIITENLLIDQSVSFSHFDNNLNTSQGDMYVLLKSKIEDISYKNKFIFPIADLSSTAGVSYTYHHVIPHDLKLENSGIITNSIVEEEIKAHDLSAFFSIEWCPMSELKIKPVLRYNYFNSQTSKRQKTKDFHSIDARLSAEYRLKDNIFLRANYSHNNQYINKLTPSSVGLPTDFWVASTEELRPQTGDEFSMGYYHALMNGNLEFSADIYYRSMSDVTQFNYNFIENDNSSFVDKITYGEGRAYGLELMAKKNFGKLIGWLSYALSKSDRKFEGINEGTRFPARYDRRHDFSATLHYKTNPRWDFSLTYIYATGNTYTQPTSWYLINNLPVKEYTSYNNARMPDYRRVDIGINYWMKENNGFNFSIYNMFLSKNPIYVFMTIKEIDEKISLKIKNKKLFRIMPSISWNFKF